MKIFVFCALGVLIGVLLFIWFVNRLRYRIGSRCIKVLLFGIPIRRIAIASIESVSKRPGDGWSEHWWSTFRPKHRLLVLRRRRGLFRNFVITPRNRYIFKMDVEKAMERTKARNQESEGEGRGLARAKTGTLSAAADPAAASD